MNQFFRTVCGYLLMASAAVALEVKDLPVEGLTREYADRNFGKNYDYYILEDNSVRRVWKEAGYTLTLDFDIRSSKLLSLSVDYQPAAPKNVALKDARHLCEGRNEGVKWVKIKEESANKVGLKDARLSRLTDGSFLFWESAGSSGECERLCWFAEAPRQDRSKIAEANAYTGRTAMGSTGSMSGSVAVLQQDEARRRGRPMPTHRQSGRPKSDPIVVTPAPDTESQSGKKPGKSVEMTNPLAALGIELDDEMKKWLMIGGGVLLLLIIWSRISEARKKAKQRAAFEALLRGDKKNKSLK
ncbi:MAG: hypothetical protein IKZ07_07680 [Akkermansia sp.]|nr:hypothetical protein [Akkermansia sp.]